MFAPIGTVTRNEGGGLLGECWQELRAYKLGKNKCSYNQVDLEIVSDDGPRRSAPITKALEIPVDNAQYTNSAVSFSLMLAGGKELTATAFVVYSEPEAIAEEPKAEGEHDRIALPGDVQGGQRWHLVRRENCGRGCSGPILRAIQRFGKMGKRFSKDASELKKDLSSRDSGSGGKEQWKQTRHMFISIDEASTHVELVNNTRRFRLLLALYDGSELLGTTVSAPIRVLANNDVPKGAAYIKMVCTIPAEWRGWSSIPEAELLSEDRLLELGGAAEAEGATARANKTPASERKSAFHPLRASFGMGPGERSQSLKIDTAPQQDTMSPETPFQRTQSGGANNLSVTPTPYNAETTTTPTPPSSNQHQRGGNNNNNVYRSYSMGLLCAHLIQEWAPLSAGTYVGTKAAVTLERYGGCRLDMADIMSILDAIGIVKKGSGGEKESSLIWYGDSRVMKTLQDAHKKVGAKARQEKKSPKASSPYRLQSLKGLSETVLSLFMDESGVALSLDDIEKAIIPPATPLAEHCAESRRHRERTKSRMQDIVAVLCATGIVEQQVQINKFLWRGYDGIHFVLMSRSVEASMMPFLTSQMSMNRSRVSSVPSSIGQKRALSSEENKENVEPTQPAKKASQGKPSDSLALPQVSCPLMLPPGNTQFPHASLPAPPPPNMMTQAGNSIPNMVQAQMMQAWFQQFYQLAATAGITPAALFGQQATITQQQQQQQQQAAPPLTAVPKTSVLSNTATSTSVPLHMPIATHARTATGGQTDVSLQTPLK